MKDDFMCSWYWIARINLRCPNLVGFIDLMKAQGYSPRWLKKKVWAPVDLSLSQMADEVGNDAGALLERTLCWCALGSQVRQVLFLLISETIVYCAILVTSGWNIIRRRLSLHSQANLERSQGLGLGVCLPLSTAFHWWLFQIRSLKFT